MSTIDIANASRSFEDAVRRGDLEAIINLYDPDAVVLAPDSPMIKGHEAISQLWKSAIEEYGLKSIRLESVELEIVGDIAYEIGNGTLDMAPPGGRQETEEMKFLVVWKRSGGQWRLHRDTWNARPA